jgi:hypothetical protein
MMMKEGNTEMDKIINGIHTGTEWDAELRHSDPKELLEYIEKLEAERDALREALRAAKDLYLHGSTTSAFIEICAALGENNGKT